MHFKRVAIVGVGLIGGSFALAVRQAGLTSHITGWNGGESLEAALSRGLIDEVETAFADGLHCDADLVYIAAPVGRIIDFLRQHGRLIKPGALVTDAGSTKRDICSVAGEWLPPGVMFIGGHPMAGSHRSGIEFADASLFSGAPYAIVTDGHHQERVEPLRILVERIGARPVLVTAAEHDRIAARISHAPQILSTALALAVALSGAPERALELAGSGFASMSRLAESPWPIWEDICRLNQDEIVAALDLVLARIEEIRNGLRSGDLDRVSAAFGVANELAGRFRRSRSETG